ncbi:MAG: hypothetical protein J6Y37_17145 [Paludibacteraceae bacterium]|nr:hypothetical protein [Paludibacteraceae bacterium]
MEESVMPIYSFNGLKNLLRIKGFRVDKAQAYRPLEVENVDLNSPRCNLEITNDGFFVIDPVDGEKRQVFLYMQNYDIEKYNDYPRFHICNCSTLQMYSRGSYRRANTARVKVKNRSDGREVWVDSLKLCQNCASKMFNAPKTTADFERVMRQAAASSERNDYKRGELDIRGYTKDWSKVSEAYRNLKQFKCEQCGVQITNPFDQCFIQVHHISGDKTDNREQNLKCLCVECHSQIDERHKKNFSTKANLLVLDDFRKKYRGQQGLF